MENIESASKQTSLSLATPSATKNTPKKNNFFKNCDIILHRNKIPSKSKKYPKKNRSRSLTKKKHKKEDSHYRHKSKKSDNHNSERKKSSKSSSHKKHKSLKCDTYISHKPNLIKGIKLNDSIMMSRSLPCSPIKTSKSGQQNLPAKVTNTPERFKNKSKLLDSSIRRNLRLNSSERDSLKFKKLKRKDKSPEMKSANKTLNTKVAKPIEITEQELALFDSLITRETDANGGATILVAHQKDLDEKLFLPNVSHEQLLDKFSLYFLTTVYSEKKNEEKASTTLERLVMFKIISLVY